VAVDKFTNQFQGNAAESMYTIRWIHAAVLILIRKQGWIGARNGIAASGRA